MPQGEEAAVRAEMARRLVALDLETDLFGPGRGAPPIVCGSRAFVDDEGHLVSGLLTPDEAAGEFERVAADPALALATANGAYDLACLAARSASLLPAIFRLLREGRHHDVLIAQALDAIYNGTLGLDPRTMSEIRDPTTNRLMKRYSLAVCVDIVLGRKDAKQRDDWRKSYALLRGVPLSRYPADAARYPVDDAENTLEVALAQVASFQNLGNLGAQARAAFALHLGALWGLRTDGDRVEALAVKVEDKHSKAVERYQKLGWVRSPCDKACGSCVVCSKAGKRDDAVIKRAVATAYGASGTCPRCGGTGKVRSVKQVPCRGTKERGRFGGCVGALCVVCEGKGTREQLGGEIGCEVSEGGCDSTGFDLSTSPLLPRTDKGGVSTSRDTLMESGDDNLYDYGENEHEKTLSTFIPYLRKGVVQPLTFSPNVLVASGRCSYEGSPIHQMPRHGGERECIRARDGYVLGSTDYEAGELCTLSTYIQWVIGYSHMRDAINESGKPGILHSALAAEVLGIGIEEFLKRLKAKDKQAVDFRQMCKPINFGTPGLMGSSTLVLTSRKKSAGFTVSEGGPNRNEKGQPGYQGVRFCILSGGARQCGAVRITEWKGRPCAPVCKDCVEIVEHTLRATYFQKFPEVKEYFKWVLNMLDDRGMVPCLAFNPEKGEVEILRWRGGLEPSAACNNGFQAMLADVGKRAFYNMTEEAYLGVKPDGSPSPLAGARFPIFMHDEPISEIPEVSAHVAGPRIAEIMVQAGRDLAPGVVWRAETAIARYLSKSMEPMYVDGRLVVWEAPDV